MDMKRFKWDTSGKALPENVISGKSFRFTVLTSRLIRMEYDPKGLFEDRATQSVFYRNFPACSYTVKEEGALLTLETEFLALTYIREQPFRRDSLSVRLKSFPGSLWNFGEQAEQLKGTARTLDGANGPVPLGDGVCSRNGYTVMDDSERMVLTEDGWFDVRPEGITDLYFFGYGHSYLDAVRDLYRLTGRPPLLPDYALGNWWSRYHAYTQQEYCDLMERFEQEKLPFSVAVVDMDWHTVKNRAPENIIPNGKHYSYSEGWTGYTWNEELFPDYRAFLRFLKEHNLKTALNLHPAQGVGCDESMYPEMARACGIDPTTRKLVKLDCLNPEFMANYFDILHHPYEENGVDFWWMDWQQGTDYWWVHDEDHPESPLEKMDPLWLLNHLHILDISRNGKRPMFFSRYCGIGSQRYPVGFSGDTHISWESLNFQPYFTATASNVGYGWWSHDIGGHMQGYQDDELTVRWIQLGVFSPINRLHSTSSPFTGKEPWNLHPYMAGIAGDWLRLRHRLFPYLYTMNYRCHKDLIPLVQPMYYSHPEKEAAYRQRNQYWFGSELMISPITEKSDPHSFMAKTTVWFPQGTWIDAFNGTVYTGDREMDVFRSLDQMPVFAKAGAIVPMQAGTGDNRLGNSETMELYLFAGSSNSFTLYEDAGDGNDYQNGAFVQTQIDLEWSDNPVITLRRARGELSLVPEKRSWLIHLRGINPPDRLNVTLDGIPVEVSFTYDPKTATVTLKLDGVDIGQEVAICVISQEALLYDNRHWKDRLYHILRHAQISIPAKNDIWHRLEVGGPLIWSCVEKEHRYLLGAMLEMQLCGKMLE